MKVKELIELLQSQPPENNAICLQSGRYNPDPSRNFEACDVSDNKHGRTIIYSIPVCLNPPSK